MRKNSGKASEYEFSSGNISSIVINESFRKSRNHGVGYSSRNICILLINCPNTTNNIFKKNFFYSFAINNWKGSHEIYHCFFREFVRSQFYIDITEFLLIVMVSEDTIYNSTYILLIIIDAYFYFISSCENRVHDKYFWEFFFEIEFENIDCFLEFSTKISLKSDGRSWWLFFWFVVSERVFHHRGEFYFIKNSYRFDNYF